MSVLDLLRKTDPELFRHCRGYSSWFQASDSRQPVVITLEKRDELKATLEAWLKNPEHAELSEWEIRMNLICIESGLVYRDHFYFNPLAINLRTMKFVPHGTKGPDVYNVRKINPAYLQNPNLKLPPHPYMVFLIEHDGVPYPVPGCYTRHKARLRDVQGKLLQRQWIPKQNLKRKAV